MIPKRNRKIGGKRDFHLAGTTTKLQKSMAFSFQACLPEIRKELEELLSKTPQKVGDFVKSGNYKTPGKQRIYAFTDPDDKEIVYIGMSTNHKNGVGGRARHHERKGRSLQAKKLKVTQEIFRTYNVRIHPIVDALHNRILCRFVLCTVVRSKQYFSLQVGLRRTRFWTL